MQPNFTLKQVEVLFLKPLLAFCLLILIGTTAVAQQYTNGPLSTGATTSNGTAAPAGFTWSEVQGANTIAGYGANITGNTVADDFTVPAGPSWGLTKISFFAYSTGYAGSTSPFDDVRVAIYNTNPSVGNPTPIFGDRTTNRFAASSSASMYRIFNATPGTTRQIFRVEANVNVTLAPGTYWIEWGVGTSQASNFSPPVTITGAAGATGANALQRTVSSGAWAALVDGTVPQAMPFIIDYATSGCSGTPAPGNTVSSSVSVCPGVNFSLSLQNATSGSGVTYQWQSSADGTTWTDISGATSPSLTRNQTASTFYRCRVTCSGNTGTSSSLLVAMAPTSACYCTPTYSFGCGLGDAITNVSIPGTTLNNSSACSTPPFTYYSSVAAPTLIAGGSYTVNVTMGADPNQHARVWFDWNQDGDFSDPGEAAGATTGSAGSNGTAVMAITVPADALGGTTRMRVRGGNDAAITATQSCGVSSSGFGEAEDYNVTIAPCIQGSFTTQPASSTITCGGNATFTVAASGSLPTYTWQFRTGPTAIWQALPNGGVVSGATTATLTLTNVPTTWNGYEIRAMFSGACTGINPSNAALLTVNPIQTVVSPASASICAGSIQRLNITNFASTSAPVTASFTSTDIPKPVPDNNTAGASSNITVSGLPAGAATVGIAVRFSVPNHTWPGDLVVVLRTPNGQILNLDNEISGTGFGPGQGMVNTVISSTGVNALSSAISATTTFTGVFRADRGTGAGAGPASLVPTTANWSDLYGPSNGVYTLGLRDKYQLDAGTLTAWSIDITYVVPSYGEGVWTAAPAVAGTMFLDAAGTIPYNGTREDTIFVRPTENTTYSVFFNSTISPCTSAPALVRVNVGQPITSLTVPATVAACVGGGFTLAGTHAAIPATNAAAIYQWQQSSDGGVNWTSISGATGLTLSVSSTSAAMNGTRYRLLAQSGGCAVAVSNTSVLTVNPLPTVTLSAAATSLVPGRTVTINGTSSPAAAANGWSWSLNGASIAGTAATQIVNVDGIGSYQATVRDVNGCINRSNVLAITGEASDKLFIYPNPTAGAFQVRYYHAGDVNEKRIISVYNPMGQLVAVKTFDLTYSTAPYLRMDVDMSGAARGTYVVKVAHEYSGKIVSGLVLVQ